MRIILSIKLSIIGAGHVGMSLLCDILLRTNYDVVRSRLYTVSPKELPSVVQFNEILGGETAVLSLDDAVCSKGLQAGALPKWLLESDVIIFTVPDIASIRIRLIEALLIEASLDGKTIVFCRGGQAGMPYWAERVSRERHLQNADFVMIEDSFYGTRFIDDAIHCKRKFRVNIALWSSNEERALTRMRKLFPPCPELSLVSWPEFNVTSPLALLFDPLGYIIHVAVAFYGPNLEKTQRGETYTHYVQGIDRILAERLCSLDRERVKIAMHYGVIAETFPEIIGRQYNKPVLNDFFEMMQSCEDIYKSRSQPSIPDLLRSRYVYEDIPPLFTMEILAGMSRGEFPATHAYGRYVRRLARDFVMNVDELNTYTSCFESADFCRNFQELMINPTASALAPKERVLLGDETLA
jgi:opine dehydrogenase